MAKMIGARGIQPPSTDHGCSLRSQTAGVIDLSLRFVPARMAGINIYASQLPTRARMIWCLQNKSLPMCVTAPISLCPITMSVGIPFALLKALVEVSAVFVAFTFIDGWSYLASFYSAFGLNPLELDVPIPVVCTTAIYVLFNAKWPPIVMVALLVAWGILAPRIRRLSRSVGMAIFGTLASHRFHGRRCSQFTVWS